MTVRISSRLLLGVSAITLALAAPVLADTYTATDDGTLRGYIGTANGDGAASSTIVLGNDVNMAPGALTPPTKDLTIDSGSFSFVRSYASASFSSGVLVFGGAATGTVTLKGKVTGVGNGGNTGGQYALVLTGGTNVINDAIVTAGDGSGTGTGGVGSLTTSSTLTNNGAITGGNSPNGTGGFGVQLSTGATLINTATVQGGNGRTGGGSGVTTSVSASTINNSGTIRAGNATTSGLGGTGVQANFASPVTNSGSIFGGNGVSGGNGVTLVGVTGVLATLNNSGAVTGGNGTTGAAGIGVNMFFAGSLTNSSTGTIQGGNSASGANGVMTQTNASTITNSGAIRGGTGATGTGGNGVTLQAGSSLTNNTGAILVGGDGPTGGSGLSANGTTLLINIVTNNGAITGGNGTTGNGGVGATLTSFTTLTNTGTITGGNSPNGQGGSGVTLSGGSVLNNSGTIQGGTGPQGGIGVDFGGPGTTATLNNSGTIQGQGANAILVRNGAGVITNTGTIQGGSGFAAISDNSLPAMSIIDGGTIAAGAGYANAIEMGGPTQTLSLELHKGYVITGNVVGNAGVANALILGGDDDASFDVSKVGPQYQNFATYQKTGNSVWTLTGAGSVATPWAIQQGTLAMSDGASIIGDIDDEATLAFKNSNALTFANTVTGAGGVNQTGSGRTNMTGNSTYTGATTISAGTLAVNGSITSAVTVANGGTLGGNGTVGATVVQSGGNIAPGNSIGTLHINGAFAANAGSVYQVEASPGSNASDLILVNGAATIGSGAKIAVTANPAGTFQIGDHYTILTATGGVTGKYDDPTPVTQYLGFRESQDANNVYLDFMQIGNPATAAQTDNQQAVAGGLPAGGAIGSGLLNSASESDARDAFDKLSGAAIASTHGAVVSGSLLVRDTALDRLRDVCSADELAGNPGCLNKDRPLVWVQGFGNWGRIGGTANAAALSHTTGGFLIGTDVPVYDWRLGFFAGYSRTDFEAEGVSSWGASDNYHLGTYAGTVWDGVALRMGASYSWNALSTERLVSFGGFSNDLTATYNAGTAQIFGEVAENFAFDRMSLEPFANLSYMNLRTYAFREGGGEAALSSQANTQEDTFTTIGLRPSTDFSIFSIPLRAKGMFGWRHTFGTVTPDATVSFAGGNAFTVTGAPIARDAGVVEAGLSTNVTESAAINLTYGAQFGGRESNNGIRGTLAVAF